METSFRVWRKHRLAVLVVLLSDAESPPPTALYPRVPGWPSESAAYAMSIAAQQPYITPVKKSESATPYAFVAMLPISGPKNPPADSIQGLNPYAQKNHTGTRIHTHTRKRRGSDFSGGYQTNVTYQSSERLCRLQQRDLCGASHPPATYIKSPEYNMQNKNFNRGAVIQLPTCGGRILR